MSIFALLKTEIHWPKIHWPKEYFLMLALCFIAFRLVMTAGQKSFYNAILVIDYQILFIILYVLILREIPPFVKIIKEHSLVTLILLLWTLSITLSLLYSPLEIWSKYYAQQRYFQTTMHVVFFLFVWDFFYRYRPPLRWLFYTIAASTIYVMAYYFYEIAVNPNLDGGKFAVDPPLNSHIRYTGIQAMAALSFFFALFFNKFSFTINNFFNAMILILLWSFLFWLGGRGSVLSILCALIFVGCVFYFKKINGKSFYLVMLAAASVGILISEWLAVFNWNGFFYNFNRTVDNIGNVAQLSTGRLDIWKESWVVIKDNLLLGLGSQGFYYMPSRVMEGSVIQAHGTIIQPHNLILQFLIEWGLIGTVLFIIVLVKAFWSGFKLHVLGGGLINKYALAAGAVIVTLSANGLTAGTYYHPKPLIYLAIAFAILIIPPSKEKPNIVKDSSS